MKKTNSRKLLFKFVVCVVVIIVAIQGIVLSWFSDSISILFSGEFRTAIIDLKKGSIETKYYNIGNFSWRDYPFMLAVIGLERSFGSDAPDKLNDDFKKLWYENNVYDNYLEDTTAPHKGGIVIKTYTFKNNSNIPVYFRIPEPTVNDVAYSAVVFIDGDYVIDSGYYYLLDPIDPTVTTFEVTVIAYIPFLANIGIDVSDLDIKITGTGEAEIIQAPNNAVYFHDDWKKVADQLR